MTNEETIKIEQRGHVWEIAYERGKIDGLNKRESEDNK